MTEIKFRDQHINTTGEHGCPCRIFHRLNYMTQLILDVQNMLGRKGQLNLGVGDRRLSRLRITTVTSKCPSENLGSSYLETDVHRAPNDKYHDI